MRAKFPQKDPKEVLSAMQKVLSGRELGNLVSLSLSGQELVVTISKLGTSTITFGSAALGGGLEFTLKNEKIAFAHRPFKDEVMKKFEHLIEQAGGKVG